jgi:hypothetical protein
MFWPHVIPIAITCDSCGVMLDTKVESSAEARYIAKKAGWISKDGLTAGPAGKDLCPTCKDGALSENRAR